MANQFGEKVKKLRESKDLLQKHIAGQLEIDSPMLSKIERGERKARKSQVASFAKVLNISKDELLALWLADQVVEVLENEDLALQAMHIAEEEVRIINQKKSK